MLTILLVILIILLLGGGGFYMGGPRGGISLVGLLAIVLIVWLLMYGPPALAFGIGETAVEGPPPTTNGLRGEAAGAQPKFKDEGIGTGVTNIGSACEKGSHPVIDNRLCNAAGGYVCIVVCEKDAAPAATPRPKHRTGSGLR